MDRDKDRIHLDLDSVQVPFAAFHFDRESLQPACCLLNEPSLPGPAPIFNLEVKFSRCNYSIPLEQFQASFPNLIDQLLLLEERAGYKIRIEDDDDIIISRKLATIGLWCIQWNATDRPSIKVVTQMLEGDGSKPNCSTSAARNTDAHSLQELSIYEVKELPVFPAYIEHSLKSYRKWQLIESLNRADGEIDFLLVVHEEGEESPVDGYQWVWVNSRVPDRSLTRLGGWSRAGGEYRFGSGLGSWIGASVVYE
ncbi:hypothetical protein HAX54_048167 [Datura stramonium]|uniref:Uncharacterized protein n=1 Tax=Datura stramonium TaxID=4076 RepID=A0ABS8STN7_DATST|nr:hypothetical protein [Datura stramonium]